MLQGASGPANRVALPQPLIDGVKPVGFGVGLGVGGVGLGVVVVDAPGLRNSKRMFAVGRRKFANAQLISELETDDPF